MNAPLLFVPSGQVHTGVELAEAVAGPDGCVGVVGRAGVDTVALLVQMEHELSSRHIRCIRVYGSSSGKLALRNLTAQIVGRPDSGSLTDDDLKAGFMALTEPRSGLVSVALLITEAHNLQPSALRYLQLAIQSSPKLRVVLVGEHGLAQILAADEFAPLRRTTRMLELAEPAAGYASSLFADVLDISPRPTASRPRRPWPLAKLSLVAWLVVLIGVIAWRHRPASPVVAIRASAPVSNDRVANNRSANDLVSIVRVQPSAPDVDAPAPPETAKPAATAQEPAIVAAAVPPPEAVSPSREQSDPPMEQRLTLPGAAPDALAAEAPQPIGSTESYAAPVDEPSMLATPESMPKRDEGPVQVVDPVAAQAPEPVTAEALDAASAVDASLSATPPSRISVPAATVLPDAVQTVRRTHNGTQRAMAPVAVLPTRLTDERPSFSADRRCRDIVFNAQLGKDPSDADMQFLRSGCRAK